METGHLRSYLESSTFRPVNRLVAGVCTRTRISAQHRTLCFRAAQDFVASNLAGLSFGLPFLGSICEASQPLPR